MFSWIQNIICVRTSKSSCSDFLSNRSDCTWSSSCFCQRESAWRPTVPRIISISGRLSMPEVRRYLIGPGPKLDTPKSTADMEKRIKKGEIVPKQIAGWWFGTFFIFPYIGNNHPNWLIFFRGVQTTNQIGSWDVMSVISILSFSQPILMWKNPPKFVPANLGMIWMVRILGKCMVSMPTAYGSTFIWFICHTLSYHELAARILEMYRCHTKTNPWYGIASQTEI